MPHAGQQFDWTAPDPLNKNTITLSIYLTELQIAVNIKRLEINQTAKEFVSQNPNQTFLIEAITELKEDVNQLAIDFGFTGGVSNSEILGREYVDIDKLFGKEVTHYPIINDLRKSLNLLIIQVTAGTDALLYGNFESPLAVNRIAVMREFNQGDDDSLKINYLVNNVSPNRVSGNFFDISTVGDTSEDTTFGQAIMPISLPKKGVFALRSFNKNDRPIPGDGIGFFVDNDEIGTVFSYGTPIADKNFVYISASSSGGNDINIMRFKRSDFENSQMSSSGGTPIGDMTDNGGLSSAFDDTTLQVSSACARKFSNIGFVGKDWGIKRLVTSVKIYPSSNLGFTFPDSLPISFILQASNDNFVTETVILGSNSSLVDIVTGSIEILVTGSNDLYQYHRIRMEIPGLANEIFIAEVQFFGFGGKLVPDQILNIPSNADEDINSQVYQSGDKLYILTREEDAGIHYTWHTSPVFEIFDDLWRLKIIQKGVSIGGGNFASMSLSSTNSLPIDPGEFILSSLAARDAFVPNPRNDGRDRQDNTNLSVFSIDLQAVDRNHIYFNYRTFVAAGATRYTTLGEEWSGFSLPALNTFLEVVPGTPTSGSDFCNIGGVNYVPGNENLDQCNVLYRRKSPLPDNEKVWITEASPRSTSPFDVEGHRGWLATATISGPSQGQLSTFDIDWTFSNPPQIFNDIPPLGYLQIVEAGILRMPVGGGSTSKFTFQRHQNAASQVNNSWQASGFTSQGDFLYIPESFNGDFTAGETELGLLVVDKVSATVKYGSLTAFDPPDDAPTQNHTFIDVDDEPDGEDAPFHTDIQNSIWVHDSLLIAGPKTPSLSAPVIGDTELTLNWSNESVTGAISYNVWFDIGNIRTLVGNFPGTSTIVGGLTNGIEVSFVVNAVGVHGDSTNSNQVSGTPVAP